MPDLREEDSKIAWSPESWWMQRLLVKIFLVEVMGYKERPYKSDRFGDFSGGNLGFVNLLNKI